jgi:hypothetical protein
VYIARFAAGCSSYVAAPATPTGRSVAASTALAILMVSSSPWTPV